MLRLGKHISGRIYPYDPCGVLQTVKISSGATAEIQNRNRVSKGVGDAGSDLAKVLMHRALYIVITLAVSSRIVLVILFSGNPPEGLVEAHLANFVTLCHGFPSPCPQ